MKDDGRPPFWTPTNAETREAGVTLWRSRMGAFVRLAPLRDPAGMAFGYSPRRIAPSGRRSTSSFRTTSAAGLAMSTALETFRSARQSVDSVGESSASTHVRGRTDAPRNRSRRAASYRRPPPTALSHRERCRGLGRTASPEHSQEGHKEWPSAGVSCC